jgi:hypothetical protein
LCAFILLCGVAYAAEAEANADWKKLYIDYIKNNPPSDPGMSYYSLIYINDDDIPELWINYGRSFEGSDLCTVSGGKLVVVHFSSVDLSYIKRHNLFLISGVRQENYTHEVYRIEGGEFVLLYKGNYGAEDNTDVQLDAAGDPIYRYYWDGKEVSAKEYELALSSVFDDSKAVAAYENSCAASDIVSMIMSF